MFKKQTKIFITCVIIDKIFQLDEIPPVGKNIALPWNPYEL